MEQNMNTTTYFYISYEEFETLLDAYQTTKGILLYGNNNGDRVLISKDAYIKLKNNYRLLQEELMREVC